MAKASEDPPSPIDAYEISGAAPTAPPAPPAYVPYPYGVPAQRTNVLAIVALVASCAGLLIAPAAIAGVITGHIALSQIKRTAENGRGMALAGVIIGYCLLALSILFIVAYVIFLAVFIGAASSSGHFTTFG